MSPHLRRAARCAVLALTACTHSTPPTAAPPTAAPDAALTTEAARSFYASQPRYLQPVETGGRAKPLPDLRASTCGQCHREIYEEWRVSTHARAWMGDAQFQEELKKSTQPGDDVGWMCVNCHTPLLEQRPKLVAHLRGGALNKPVYIDNPDFDADLQLEAITCATCHVRDGVIVGPYGDTEAPHPTRKGAVLTTSALCMKCHQAVARFDELNLLCAFNTGNELLESAGGMAGQTCQGCHMPEITRPITHLGTPPREGRRHWFPGSLVPKHPDFAKELAPMAARFEPGLEARWVDLPEGLEAGRTVTLTAQLTNTRAGHLLPTGDPERFIKVEASAVATSGATLGEAEVKIGAVYVWHPKARKISDNRLKPGASMPLTLKLSVPERLQGPITLKLRATHWRISEENFEYHHLEGRSVTHRVFLESEISLPVTR